MPSSSVFLLFCADVQGGRTMMIPLVGELYSECHPGRAAARAYCQALKCLSRWRAVEPVQHHRVSSRHTRGSCGCAPLPWLLPSWTSQHFARLLHEYCRFCLDSNVPGRYSCFAMYASVACVRCLDARRRSSYPWHIARSNFLLFGNRKCIDFDQETWLPLRCYNCAGQYFR